MHHFIFDSRFVGECRNSIKLTSTLALAITLLFCFLGTGDSSHLCGQQDSARQDNKKKDADRRSAIRLKGRGPVRIDPGSRQPIRNYRDQEDKKKKNPFDGKAAMKDLVAICKIGPRISGTAGMAKQQAMLIERFEKLGAKIKKQEFEVPHPVTRRMVTLTNLIVQWHPDKKKRILICTHYDTRPLPDRDKVNPTGVFIGANDGASGGAFLMELGRHIKDLDGEYGIDFVLFDAEEFVYQRPRDPLFIGSTYFANQYRKQDEVKYVCGILVDMIADAHLDLYYEKNSLKYAKTLTQSIWATAAELNIREFVPKARHEIRDDHLPLNTIAKIPTCDIIDFDYPTIRKNHAYWHTRMDQPDKCSGESLAKVGWVLIEWLKKAQKKREQMP